MNIGRCRTQWGGLAATAEFLVEPKVERTEGPSVTRWELSPQDPAGPAVVVDDYPSTSEAALHARVITAADLGSRPLREGELHE